LNKTILRERDKFPMCTHAHAFLRVIPWRSVAASHGVFCHISSLQI
jgi:hypothetical protein